MLSFALKAVFVAVLGIRVAMDANWGHKVMPLLKVGLGRKAHLSRSCIHFWAGSPLLCSEGFLGSTWQGEVHDGGPGPLPTKRPQQTSIVALNYSRWALEMFREATPWSLCSSPELRVQAWSSTHSPSPEQAAETSYGSASRIPFASFCSFLANLGLPSGDKDPQPRPTQCLMPLLAFQTSEAFWPVAQRIVFTSSLRDTQSWEKKMTKTA